MARGRICGGPHDARYAEFTTTLKNAWDLGWRPPTRQAKTRLWCLAGCGSSIYTRDQRMHLFICTACREEAAAYAPPPAR